MRARWVAKECTTRAKPELYASTSPLEALRAVLFEVATGERGGKVVALVDVRRVFVELPPEDHEAGDNHMGCCNTRMLDFGQFDFGQFDFGQLAEIELAEVEIGRSRNWPKSKLAEVEQIVVLLFSFFFLFLFLFFLFLFFLFSFLFLFFCFFLFFFISVCFSCFPQTPNPKPQTLKT